MSFYFTPFYIRTYIGSIHTTKKIAEVRTYKLVWYFGSTFYCICTKVCTWLRLRYMFENWKWKKCLLYICCKLICKSAFCVTKVQTSLAFFQRCQWWHNEKGPYTIFETTMWTHFSFWVCHWKLVILGVIIL